MATINLSNAQTQDVARQMLWNLWLSIDNDRVDANSEPILFVQQLSDKVQLFSQIHQAMSSGVVDSGTKILTANDSTLKFFSTAFSDEKKDRDITIQFNGTNLSKNNASTQVNKVILDFVGTQYIDGLPKTPSNIEQKESNIATWQMTYSPSTLINSITSDDAITYTSLTTSKGKSEGFYINDYGNKITENETYKNDMQGTFILGEQGSVNGLLKSFSYSSNKVASDGGNTKSSFSLNSQAGLAFNEKQTFTGSALPRVNYEYKNGSYSQLINFTDTQENSLFSQVLTEFLKGNQNITDLASALLNGDDKITAKIGNNTINGFAGNDSLTAGKGNDLFQFTTSLNAIYNVDKITGFKKSGFDKIQLDDSIFVGYSGANNFALMGKQIIDANDRILYDTNSGQLFYDADGNGSIAPVQFATLVGKPALSANDIDII